MGAGRLGGTDDSSGGMADMTKAQAKGHMIQAAVMSCCFIVGIIAERTGTVDSISIWMEQETGIDLPWVDQPAASFFSRWF